MPPVDTFEVSSVLQGHTLKGCLRWSFIGRLNLWMSEMLALQHICSLERSNEDGVLCDFHWQWDGMGFGTEPLLPA